MCCNKRTIVNNSKTFQEGVSRLTMSVPCGHCSDCQMTKQDDYALRLCKEIDSYNNDIYYDEKRKLTYHGKVLFVTLTYNELCKPVVDLPDEDGVLHKLPCFNPADKDRFLYHLKNKFRDYRDKDKFPGRLPLKYFFACEYGTGKSGTGRSTYRPHYHVLLFFPAHFCMHKSLQTRHTIEQMCRKLWTTKAGYSLGYVIFSREDKGGLFVKGMFGALYASKYIGKDQAFFSNPLVKNFFTDNNGKFNYGLYFKYKNYFPHVWTSNGIGIGLVEEFNNYQAYAKGVERNYDKTNGKSRYFKIPRYIERKILYDQTKDGRFILNETGKKFQKQLFSDNLEKAITELRQYYNIDLISDFAKLPGGKLDFNGHHFTDVGQLREYIRKLSKHYAYSFVNSDFFRDLYLYKTCWRGLFYTSNSGSLEVIYSILPKLDSRQFTDLSIQQYNRKFDYVDLENLPFDEDGIFKNPSSDYFSNDIDAFQFNYNERFAHFEEVLSIFDILKSNNHRLKNDFFQSHKQEIKELHNATQYRDRIPGLLTIKI